MSQYTIKIVPDTMPESPREWDHGTHMIGFHRRYQCGDKHDFRDPSEVEAHIKETRAIALPVYMYDHSGVVYSTGPFGCPWDSGQVGYIYMERAEVLHSYSVKRITAQIREKVLNYLKSHVETYSQWANGDVWGYVIEDESGAHVDSCYGVYGYEECEKEAQAALAALEGTP